jgi:hypothetical protein
LLGVCSSSVWAGGSAGVQRPFSTALDSYQDSGLESINAQLLHRIRLEPFNLVAILIFLCAIVHTFMASKFMAMSHARGQAHQPCPQVDWLAEDDAVHHLSDTDEYATDRERPMLFETE